VKWEDLATELRNWGRWGDEDELGTVNFIDAAAVLRGARAIRRGEVISLAANFDASGPAAGIAGRFNPQHYMTATPLDGPEQASAAVAGGTSTTTSSCRCSAVRSGTGCRTSITTTSCTTGSTPGSA